MVYVIQVCRQLSRRTRMELQLILVLLESCHKRVCHIPLLSVQWINSWWWTDELAEACRVSCQNKFVKLVHVVGFITKKKDFRQLHWKVWWWTRIAVSKKWTTRILTLITRGDDCSVWRSLLFCLRQTHVRHRLLWLHWRLNLTWQVGACRSPIWSRHTVHFSFLLLPGVGLQNWNLTLITSEQRQWPTPSLDLNTDAI